MRHSRLRLTHSIQICQGAAVQQVEFMMVHKTCSFCSKQPLTEEACSMETPACHCRPLAVLLSRPSVAADRLHMWSVTLHPPGSASAAWREHQLPPHSGPSDTAAGPAAAAWAQPAATETPAPSSPRPPPACQSCTASMPAGAEEAV